MFGNRNEFMLTSIYTGIREEHKHCVKALKWKKLYCCNLYFNLSTHKVTNTSVAFPWLLLELIENFKAPISKYLWRWLELTLWRIKGWCHKENWEKFAIRPCLYVSTGVFAFETLYSNTFVTYIWTDHKVTVL